MPCTFSKRTVCLPLEFDFLLCNYLQEDDRYFTLNASITEIFLRLSEWIDDGTLATEKFLEFIENFLLGQVMISANAILFRACFWLFICRISFVADC